MTTGEDDVRNIPPLNVQKKHLHCGKINAVRHLVGEDGTAPGGSSSSRQLFCPWATSPRKSRAAPEVVERCFDSVAFVLQ